jgi:hypothetical protein
VIESACAPCLRGGPNQRDAGDGGIRRSTEAAVHSANVSEATGNKLVREVVVRMSGLIVLVCSRPPGLISSAGSSPSQRPSRSRRYGRLLRSRATPFACSLTSDAVLAATDRRSTSSSKPGEQTVSSERASVAATAPWRVVLVLARSAGSAPQPGQRCSDGGDDWRSLVLGAPPALP